MNQMAPLTSAENLGLVIKAANPGSALRFAKEEPNSSVQGQMTGDDKRVSVAG